MYIHMNISPAVVQSVSATKHLRLYSRHSSVARRAPNLYFMGFFVVSSHTFDFQVTDLCWPGPLPKG